MAKLTHSASTQLSLSINGAEEFLLKSQNPYKILIRRGQAARNHPVVRVSSRLPTAWPLKKSTSNLRPSPVRLSLPIWNHERSAILELSKMASLVKEWLKIMAEEATPRCCCGRESEPQTNIVMPVHSCPTFIGYGNLDVSNNLSSNII